MSIIYNNQVVSGKYKEQIINNSDTLNAGIIKIATQEEIEKGEDNSTAVTPFYLSQKQDKLVAGDNIIMDENLIECNIYADNKTIIQNEDGIFTNIGQLTKSGTIKIDWEGTTAEYTEAMLNGTIQPEWYCYITDDEEFVDYADVCSRNLNNLTPEGEARFTNKANIDLDNLSDIGQNKINSLVTGKADINLSNLTLDGLKVIRENSGGLELFDTILKDHILTYEESKGLALQGTWVYKEAIAGSRYGYPDFYNKVVEEYNEASQLGAQTITVGDRSISMFVHPNGHMYYTASEANITSVNNFFDAVGVAWFYGLDTVNKRVLLPKKNLLKFSTTRNFNVSVFGTGQSLGLTSNGTNSYRLKQTATAEEPLQAISGGLTTLPATSETAGATSTNNYIFGVNTSASKSGLKGSVDLTSLITEETDSYLYICVGNTTNYEGMTEVVNQGMEILAQVADKVNVDGTNLNAEGKSLFASYAMPSNRYVDLTLGANGSTYTAPANGYVVFGKAASAAGQYIQVATGSLINQVIAVSTGNILSIFIPVAKGKTFKVAYSVGGATNSFRFIYAEGDK